MYGLDPDMPDTDQFDDQTILALTAWGEARGIGKDGMQGTINTIQNRLTSGVRWWGHSLRSIALHPWQYSCWNANDANRPKLFQVTKSDPQFSTAMLLASQAISGMLPDLVAGADSYYNPDSAPLPAWARGIQSIARIGPHLYYRTV